MAKKKDLIKQAQEAYDNGKPIMTDAQFDALTEEAPLNMSDGGKVKHEEPMLSQGKCHAHDEVEKFMDDTRDSKYTVSLKVDGFACSLLYVCGKLAVASTRGDGDNGEDITKAVLKYVSNVPRTLKEAINIEIRGEIFYPSQVADNARNIAVGMCKRKEDSLVDEPIGLYFNAWDIVSTPFDYEFDKIKYAESLGFTWVPCAVLDRSAGVAKSIELMEAARDDFSGQADGIVFKCNSVRLQKKIGATQHHPKYSIAFKFPVPTVVTTVEKIEITTGKKSGKRTPVAYLTPVMCGGAVVKKVSLGSEAVMEEMGVKEGCKVELERAGGVIPHIKRVVK